VRRTKWAAVAVMVMALGATSCGTDDADTGTAGTPASARPGGTGPLTKADVRADLDTAAAEADVPANEEFARGHADAPTGSPRSCSVALKAWAADGDAAEIDVARYDALVRELREREWQVDDRRARKTPDGGTDYVRMILKQRGWTLFAEFMSMAGDGMITVSASDDACMKKAGASVDQVA
jgi:hypothetical protein